MHGLERNHIRQDVVEAPGTDGRSEKKLTLPVQRRFQGFRNSEGLESILDPETYDCVEAKRHFVGGDDLTFIIRGDLALDFTAVFLKKFQMFRKRQLIRLLFISLSPTTIMAFSSREKMAPAVLALRIRGIFL
jgi:hypothetical protein